MVVANPIRQWLGVVWASGLAGAIAALLFLAWLADEALEGDTLQFDEWASGSMHRHATQTLTSVMLVITSLGSTLVLIILGIVTLIVLLYVGWRRAGLMLSITMAGAFLLNAILKASFRRQRPVPFFGLTAPSSFSFPSGHALLSFCFYGGLAMVVAAHLQSRPQRIAVWVTTGVLVILIGISRVYLGMHYASDVIAGFTAAFIWVVAVNFAYRFWRSRGQRSRHK